MWSPAAPNAHEGSAAVPGTRRRRRGRAVLLQLAVRLLVEIGKWMP